MSYPTNDEQCAAKDLTRVELFSKSIREQLDSEALSITEITELVILMKHYADIKIDDFRFRAEEMLEEVNKCRASFVQPK